MAKTSYIKELDVKLKKGKFKNPIRGQVTHPEQLYDVFKNIKDKGQETLIGSYFNSEMEALAYNVLSLGSHSSALAKPRDIFGYGFVLMAKYIVLVHNHPSGITEPSEGDQAVMKNLIRLSKDMDMSILDFIIIGELKEIQKGKKNYWSMFESFAKLDFSEGNYKDGPIF